MSEDGPDDHGRARRMEWANLLRRVIAVDVLVCGRCAGRMRMIGMIEDERTARKILEHVGLPARAPLRGQPWRPGEQLSLDDASAPMDGVDPLAFD